MDWIFEAGRVLLSGLGIGIGVGLGLVVASAAVQPLAFPLHRAQRRRRRAAPDPHLRGLHQGRAPGAAGVRLRLPRDPIVWPRSRAPPGAQVDVLA